MKAEREKFYSTVIPTSYSKTDLSKQNWNGPLASCSQHSYFGICPFEVGVVGGGGGGCWQWKFNHNKLYLLAFPPFCLCLSLSLFLSVCLSFGRCICLSVCRFTRLSYFVVLVCLSVIFPSLLPSISPLYLSARHSVVVLVSLVPSHLAVGLVPSYLAVGLVPSYLAVCLPFRPRTCLSIIPLLYYSVAELVCILFRHPTSSVIPALYVSVYSHSVVEFIYHSLVVPVCQSFGHFTYPYAIIWSLICYHLVY